MFLTFMAAKYNFIHPCLPNVVYIDLLAGNICNRDVLAEIEADDEIFNVDNKYMDPQLCATFACDIYKHLRASEVC
jgi:hypothetical protein